MELSVGRKHLYFWSDVQTDNQLERPYSGGAQQASEQQSVQSSASIMHPRNQISLHILVQFYSCHSSLTRRAGNLSLLCHE